MKEILYVIACRDKFGRQVYLCVDEERSKNKYDKVYFKWTDKIEDAYADFNGYHVEDFAKNYFTYFKDWYIVCYRAKF